MGLGLGLHTRKPCSSHLNRDTLFPFLGDILQGHGIGCRRDFGAGSTFWAQVPHKASISEHCLPGLVRVVAVCLAAPRPRQTELVTAAARVTNR